MSNQRQTGKAPSGQFKQTMNYQPDNPLDALIPTLRLKNDADLARALGVAPSHISKLRIRHLAVGASKLIRMHELSGLSIRDLRFLMGDRRKQFRFGGMLSEP